LASAQEKCQ